MFQGIDTKRWLGACLADKDIDCQSSSGENVFLAQVSCKYLKIKINLYFFGPDYFVSDNSGF